MDAADKRKDGPADAIREELNRILASQAFLAADRRARLLRFLVEESLANRAESLKESVLATEVFDRPPGYDPKIDSIVRVEMGRLRSRLTEYYSQAGARDPIRVEIPKGSYQPAFIFIATDTATAEAAAPQERVPSGTRHLPIPIAIGVSVALILAGVLFWRFRAGTRPDTVSIAVLPFLNLSGESNKNYVADSLSDELTETLAESKELRVVARTSAFQFKGKSEDVREIGRALNAEAILEGSVGSRDGSYRIVVQLIRAADGYHLWSHNYETSASELSLVEVEIAEATARSLLPSRKGTTPVIPASTRVASANPQAHDLYMRAIYQLQLHTPDSLRESLRLSEEAVRIDPQYARAYFAIARAETSLSAIGVISGREAAERGKAAAQKALAAAPDFSDAHAYMAYLLYTYDWNWTAAEKEYALALEASGSHGQAHSLYGWSLMTRKRFAEARSHLQTAEELDPQSPGSRQNLVNDLVFERDFTAAKREVAGIFKLYPKSLVGIRDLGLIGIWEHDCVAAKSAAETAARWYPDQSDPTGSPTMKARCGEPSAARRQLEEMAKQSEKEFISPYTMAQGYASLGDADHAIDYLRRSADAKESLVLYMGIDALLDPVRRDPRFVEFQTKIGLP
ncbi:MAG TPA: hypothetical protein VMH80_12265 [Bryobacteraceae bacterium]|nr:hypothetical protein [Bryobacteraceae bacterium]